MIATRRLRARERWAARATAALRASCITAPQAHVNHGDKIERARGFPRGG